MPSGREVSSWVQAGGTRFVPPGDERDENGHLKSVSDERKQLSDELLRGVVPSLRAVVHIDLQSCDKLTDASIVEVARGCPQLQSIDVSCVGARRSRRTFALVSRRPVARRPGFRPASGRVPRRGRARVPAASIAQCPVRWRAPLSPRVRSRHASPLRSSAGVAAS